MASDGSEQGGDTCARSQLLQTPARCARPDGDLDRAYRLLLAALEFSAGSETRSGWRLWLSKLSQAQPAETGSRQDRQVLTRREREVAELVGAGLSNRQIAER